MRPQCINGLATASTSVPCYPASGRIPTTRDRDTPLYASRRVVGSAAAPLATAQRLCGHVVSARPELVVGRGHILALSRRRITSGAYGSVLLCGEAPVRLCSDKGTSIASQRTLLIQLLLVAARRSPAKAPSYTRTATGCSGPLSSFSGEALPLTETLGRLKDPGFDPAQAVLWKGTAQPTAQRGGRCPPSRHHILQANSVSVAAALPQEGYLVLSDA